MSTEHLRNVAIIAHVDHGKTTLVDRLLYQSGMFRTEELDRLAGGTLGLIMDSDPLERERGITILSKNCSVHYAAQDRKRYKINIIDTPGHADFGGEVERVLKMADGVLLLVDAFEGPMPQTRFVLQKALQNGLKPIVVVNKVDRQDERAHDVVSEVFDLLIELGADDDALDFPTIFASAREGWASHDPDDRPQSMQAVFDVIVEHVPPPEDRGDKPLQMLVTSLDYSDYVGRIAIGRVFGGSISRNTDVGVIDRSGNMTCQRAQQLLQFEGLGRKEVESVPVGEICAVVGFDKVDIGDTITDIENPHRIPPVAVDEPTLDMTFRLNDGPFAGLDGTYVTTRQLGERLQKELRSNVALRVASGATSDEFRVSGRGLMHLGILMENMRREGYELCAGKPKVIFREIDGKTCEPVELLTVDCPLSCQSPVMGLVGERRGELTKIESRAGLEDTIHMEFKIPARGLIGLRSRMLTATQGNAVMHHVFLEYLPMRGEIPHRQTSVMVATDRGRVTAYALDALYDRGVFFVRPGDEVYEGQVVGEIGQDKDIEVNVVKAKHLTNIRSSTKEDGARVRPPREMSLELALEYIQEDELVEITPRTIRLRKRLLTLGERRRSMRSGAGALR